MRGFLLLCLLALGHAKPYQPINVLDFMRDHEIMMQDEDDDDDDDDFLTDCPFGCQCSLRVVQCSDLGLLSVPENIPADTLMIDLQNNDITEVTEDDFKGINKIYALFLVNNKISKIHPKAFRNMDRLQLLYLSYNQLTRIPANLPRNILELQMSANPLANNGIELGAFDDLPSSLTDLHLDYNKITKVEIEDFFRYKKLQRLGLGFNQIKFVENGSLASIPNVREIHLDNNKLKKVPPGLNSLRYLQVVYLHANTISNVGVNDFCPVRSSVKKTLYTGISLFSNPVKYWDVQPATFRCVSGRSGVQLGNNRRRK
ncbi:unnamed protein product [Coregonus sp. 'balchen']|nr:unnamed protein product [Coregonus sp. 'balchen']